MAFVTLIPLAAWVLFFLFLRQKDLCWRTAFLAASVAWGVAATFLTEVLSIFESLNRPSLAVGWILLALASGVLYGRNRSVHKGQAIPVLARVDKLIVATISAILMLTFVISVASPPNNYDSMTYHLGRAVHWIQNGSVAHYPTHFTPQLYHPPWAEFAITHFMILSGGDYLANLVQWFAMLGSLLAVSLIARQLHADRMGEISAAAFCAAIPMGILQASGTQNDYVEAFWLTCFVHFGMELREKPQWRMTVLAGSSLGLAALTKGVAYVYAFPFIIWFLLSGLKRYPRNILTHLSVIALIFLTLNLGHYSRNYGVFGNPLSTDNVVMNNEAVNIKSLVSNASRNFMLHFAGPYEKLNNRMVESLISLHDWLNIDIRDPRTTLDGVFYITPNNMFHEDTAGNALHVLLIIFITILLVASRRIRQESSSMAYLFSMYLLLILYCLCFKWQPCGTRLQLAAFVLWSPLIAVVLSKASKTLNISAVMAVLATAFFWCVLNQSKPLVGRSSIFSIPRNEQYFSNHPTARNRTNYYADSILRSGYMNIGLIVDLDAYEYPLWALVREKAVSMPRMEHVYVNNRSGRIPLKAFDPQGILYIFSGKRTVRDGKLYQQ